VRCLGALLEARVEVPLVITHRDDPQERIWFASVAERARSKGIDTLLDPNIDAVLPRLRALAPDFIFSFYYRRMLPPEVLATARRGAYNMHGSLLPKYRGRAPVNWAVLHGEPRIGMTLHRMVKSADAGAVVDQDGVDIGPRDTAEQAFRKVLPCARRVLARQIDALLAGTAKETPQDESQVTYFGGRKPEDGRIAWTRTSAQIFNLIRAVTDPYPGAFTDVGGARLMVWWVEPDSAAAKGRKGKPGEILAVAPLVVATGDGALELSRVEWRNAPAPGLRVGQVI